MTIQDLIPQRRPFLYVEDNFEILENKIKTRYHFSDKNDFFQGHFPDQPVVPGVIMCEHCFQSAAALMGSRGEVKQLAVVSRIQSAKFKNIVSINETILTETTLIEELGSAAYFRSLVKNNEGKKVLIIEFACTLVADK